MNLNLNGNCQKSFFIALAFVVVTILALFLPRTREFADIPEMTAAQSVTSENEILEIRKGETIRIIGAKKLLPNKHEKGDKEKKLMLSVQNAKGERDFVLASDVITAQELEEIMPELLTHEFSNSHGAFNRRTMTSEKFDSIQIGTPLERVERILYPEEKLKTVDGVLTGKYDKADVFVAKTGQFYVPVLQFKDGRVSDIKLESVYKTHQNAWLLKTLPGQRWIIDHNVFNLMSQKKCFGRMERTLFKIDMNANLVTTILGYVIVIILLVLLFAFYLVMPVLPAMLIYGIFIFPHVVKLFNNLTIRIFLGLILLISTYYVWVAYMAYAAWWITLPAFGLIIEYMFNNVFCDRLCGKCKFMNTAILDHEELYKEYDTTRRIEESKTLSERTNVTRYSTQVTETMAYGQTSSYEKDIRYVTKTKRDYRNYQYDVTYHVKEYIQYFKCFNCGHITMGLRTESQIINKEYKGSYDSSSTSETTSTSRPSL